MAAHGGGGSSSRPSKKVTRQGTPSYYPKGGSSNLKPLLDPSNASFERFDSIDLNDDDAPRPDLTNDLSIRPNPLPTDRLPPAQVHVVLKSKSSGVTRGPELDGTIKRHIRLKDLVTQLEPTPEPTTRGGKIKERIWRGWMRVKHPNTDPDFMQYPGFLHNRIRNKDPFRDKYRRVIKRPRKLLKRRRARPYVRPADVPTPMLRLVDGALPVPPRHCQHLKPHKTETVGPVFDSYNNPAGKEFDIFFETKEQREARIKTRELEVKWREMSNDIIRERGRKHLEEPCIGRAPPLAKQILTDIQLKKTPELFRKTPKAGEHSKQIKNRDATKADPQPEATSSNTKAVKRSKKDSPHVLGIKVFTDLMSPSEDGEEIEMEELGPQVKPESSTASSEPKPQPQPQPLGSSSSLGRIAQHSEGALVDESTTPNGDCELVGDDKDPAKQNEASKSAKEGKQCESEAVESAIGNRQSDSELADTGPEIQLYNPEAAYFVTDSEQLYEHNATDLATEGQESEHKISGSGAESHLCEPEAGNLVIEGQESKSKCAYSGAESHLCEPQAEEPAVEGQQNESGATHSVTDGNHDESDAVATTPGDNNDESKATVLSTEGQHNDPKATKSGTEGNHSKSKDGASGTEGGQQAATPDNSERNQEVNESSKKEKKPRPRKISGMSKEAGLIRPLRLSSLVSARQANTKQRNSTATTENPEPPPHDVEDLYSADYFTPTMRNGQQDKRSVSKGAKSGLSHSRMKLSAVHNSPQVSAEEMEGSPSANDEPQHSSGAPTPSLHPTPQFQPSCDSEFAERKRRLSIARGPRFPVRPSPPTGLTEGFSGPLFPTSPSPVTLSGEGFNRQQSFVRPSPPRQLGGEFGWRRASARPSPSGQPTEGYDGPRLPRRPSHVTGLGEWLDEQWPLRGPNPSTRSGEGSNRSRLPVRPSPLIRSSEEFDRQRPHTRPSPPTGSGEGSNGSGFPMRASPIFRSGEEFNGSRHPERPSPATGLGEAFNRSRLLMRPTPPLTGSCGGYSGSPLHMRPDPPIRSGEEFNRPRRPSRPSPPTRSTTESNGSSDSGRLRRIIGGGERYPTWFQSGSSLEATSSPIVGGSSLHVSPAHPDSSQQGASGGCVPSPIPERSPFRTVVESGGGDAQNGQRHGNRNARQGNVSGTRAERVVGVVFEEQAERAPNDLTSHNQPSVAAVTSNNNENLQETGTTTEPQSVTDTDNSVQQRARAPSFGVQFVNRLLGVDHLRKAVARVQTPASTTATPRIPISPIPLEEYNGTLWPEIPGTTSDPPREVEPAVAPRPDVARLSRNSVSQGSSCQLKPTTDRKADTDITSQYRPAKTGEEYSFADDHGRPYPVPVPRSRATRPQVTMDSLQVRPVELSLIKAKATEDARQMQAQVIETCTKAGKDPPKYALLELIGKGTFGRVYKGKDMTSAAIVAVKIIDIDESDTVNPRQANSYSEFLKEVNALKILSESKARNINHVIEALPVGQAMWMITEHCGGGSIATLMKPTAPGGLQEKWIIPIAREVAEGLKWVHQADIIHRDIKCANILITEEGGVQVCDFGVAGVIEGTTDKRSTIIGTPHWMAPELFTAAPSYGKEVDIWAFGCMVFEMATGLPPNVAAGISYPDLGEHLKNNVPRLEGGKYSDGLRDIVAYCLEETPSARPPIEQVQRHPYIANTGGRYPASGLSHLVRAFKMWEDHGGSRQSLFMAGGAQGPSESSGSVYGDEWNFSTTAVFDQEVSQLSSAQDVYDVYGSGVVGFNEDTARPKGSRRRPPPEALSRLPPPLAKVFDPNTLSTYEDNSRNHYGRPTPPPTSDLPLRDDSARVSIRDTMIDLGGHDPETGLSSFPDMDTIRPGGRPVNGDDEAQTGHDFSRPALSDPADINPNRRTQDWKFPSMAPPASADPEVSRFPTAYDLPRPPVTPGSNGRPALVHHPTEPMGAQFGGLLGTTQAAPNRVSMAESLIDLDMSMPDTYPGVRPSTANSDAGSATSEQMASGNPFEFEGRVSYQAPVDGQESTHYLGDEGASPPEAATDDPPRDITEMSDFSASDAEGQEGYMDHNDTSRYEASSFSDSDYVSMPRLTGPFNPEAVIPGAAMPGSQNDRTYTMAHFPPLPSPPSAAALAGIASREEMVTEVSRALGSMIAQLDAFGDVYESRAVAQKRGSRRK